MKIAVRYYSRGGNTKKLADAIARAAGVKAETVDKPLTEPVDVLFLGSSVYAAGVDDSIKKFINELNPSMAKRIINFSTAALLPSTYNQVSKLLSEKGMRIDPEEFHCRGSFAFMHKGHPDQKDLNDAEEFVKKVLS